MPRIRVMADSTCDLPAEWVRRFAICVVPTYVHFGQESLRDDGAQLTRTAFYQRLVTASPLPTTAAPPLGETIEIMAQALQEADHVIAITAAAKLSALHNIFRLAAEQTDPRRVTLIDSQMISMGLGWQVVIAAEMAQAGATPEEINMAVLDVQQRSEVWAALDTMVYLRHSGRVNWAAAVMGDLFQIKPLIRVEDGAVNPVTRVRTSRRAFDTLVNLGHRAAPLERLAVLHTNYPEGVKRLASALADVHPKTELAIVDVTPVIGVHAGPNALGLAVVRQQI